MLRTSVPKICIICDVMTMSNCNLQFSATINNNPMCGVALAIKTCVIDHCKMYSETRVQVRVASAQVRVY